MTVKHLRYSLEHYAMGMVVPVNSLVVTKNRWLILLSQNWFFLFCQIIHQKFSKILNSSKSVLTLTQLEWLLHYWQLCDYSQNKSCETHLGPRPTFGDRNTQLIYKKRVVSRIKPSLLPKNIFSKHIKMKTKWKQKLITKVINLIKLEGLGGESCWSN
jgi:hypothetical protein